MAKPNKQAPILTTRDLEEMWPAKRRWLPAKLRQPNDASPVLAILRDSETQHECYQVVRYVNNDWLFLTDPAGRIQVDRWIPLLPLTNPPPLNKIK